MHRLKYARAPPPLAPPFDLLLAPPFDPLLALIQCETLSNLLVEKLDPSTVRVFSPEVVPLHPQRLAELRRETCLLAVHNAKQKAAEIAKHFGPFCSLGPPISIKEEEVEEWNWADRNQVGRMGLSRYFGGCRVIVTELYALERVFMTQAFY